MATMITKVYEALKEAGVSESKAIKAAEAIQHAVRKIICISCKNRC